MVDHHIQKAILYKLVTSPSARFADLRPKGVDGNIFTYHLKQLVAQKLIIKQADGSYCLTSAGKQVGINIELSNKGMLEQAHSILLMLLENSEGKLLLRKRLAHPMYGKLGFVHGEPEAHKSIADSAHLAFLRRTGLSADFTPIGSGYIRLLKDPDLESFTHFTMMKAQSHDGKLIDTVGNGQNQWLELEKLDKGDVIPSTYDLLKHIRNSDGSYFFCELEYQV